MQVTIIKGAKIINRGLSFYSDVLIKNEKIEIIAPNITFEGAYDEINAENLILIPGIIDDQVHFREPGLTYKGDIASESKAAVAGGVTTFMEMPNTKPPAVSQHLLEQKYQIAQNHSFGNYSFFMGVTNDNYDEVLKTNPKDVCGIKIFMGSSTGNMLVDEPEVLHRLFANTPLLIATHCEDEATIQKNINQYKKRYGSEMTTKMHPNIRNAEACFISSSFAIELAKKYNTRLHILHISTKDELNLFSINQPLKDKMITSEVCVHHLYFDSSDYAKLGNQIKCNPAIKSESHRIALFQGLMDDKLDIIATDHAPHSWEEKSLSYDKTPSGLPLVQHGLNIMLDFYYKNMITLEKIIEKMCHAPAECFKIKNRGYIDEGMYADLALVDLNLEWQVDNDNVYYKCGWTPLHGIKLKGKVVKTFVNGTKVYDANGTFRQGFGKRLQFERSI